MANNLMFLVYKPTMEGVIIGKRMSSWYVSGEVGNNINFLYERSSETSCKSNFSMDDFFICMEDETENTIRNESIQVLIWGINGNESAVKMVKIKEK